MIKYLAQPIDKFQLQKALLYVCKKSSLSGSQQPQIDFLLVQSHINELQQLQQKTCQSIVQFVDEHREQFINIITKLDTISESVAHAEVVLSNLNNKIDNYRETYYTMEATIQKVISDYESSLYSKQLIQQCKNQSEFLRRFCEEFQKITTLSVEKLNFKQQHLITRFTYKLQKIRSVVTHHMIVHALPEHLKLNNLLSHLSDEIQFFLSEQLARITQKGTMSNPSLKNIRLWFTYLGKEQDFYKIIQDNLIGRQLTAIQRLIINNKVSILSGKQVQLVNQVFHNIFQLINQFPKDYDTNRILKIIFQFLKKPELKFLYTYAMPVFPVTFSAYMSAVKLVNQNNLRHEFLVHHSWDLKRWADMRETTILQRSLKDPDLFKWIQIIFKPGCMIEGVKSKMIQIALKLINRYTKVKMIQLKFTAKNMNLNVKYMKQIPILFKQKIIHSYLVENIDDMTIIQRLAGKLQFQLTNTFQMAMLELLKNNFKLLVQMCTNNLQINKNFVMKSISNRDKNIDTILINQKTNLYHPMICFFNNNEEFNQYSKQIISKHIEKQIILHYDESYVPNVYNYAKNNLTTEQVTFIMEVLTHERKILFTS